MDIDKLTNYDNLSSDAKEILNKTMDIYWNIKDTEINVKVKDIFNMEKDYIFNEIDKKVISLYLSCFMSDTKLKKELEEYKDISENNIISFLGIKKDDIKPLYYESYRPFYEMNFKNIIKDMLKSKQNFFEPKKIDSESIYFLMRNIKVAGSAVLNYLSSYYTKEKFLCKHPSFEKIGKEILSKTYTDDSKIAVEDNKTSDRSNLEKGEIFEFPANKSKNEFWFDTSYSHTYLPDMSDKEKLKLRMPKETLRKLDILSRRYVCQNDALDKLFISAIRNQFNDSSRPIVFLNGQSGTGKTAITADILDDLRLPSCIISSKNYFLFSDDKNILKSLYESSYGNMEKAQKGVIVYDDGLRGDNIIAKQILELLDGKTLKINVGTKNVPIYVDFDTSKLTFIFIDNLLKNDMHGVTTKEDLIDSGYDPRLAEKINTYIDTKRYSKNDFIYILNNSTISPILKLQNWVSSMNKNLKIENDAIEKISDIAYDLGLGFKGLETVIYGIKTQLMGNVFFGKEKEIVLDVEVIESVYDSLSKGKHI